MPRGMHQSRREVLQLQQEATREEDKIKRRTKAVEDEQAEARVLRGKCTTDSANTKTLASIDLAEGDAYSVTGQVDAQRRDNTGDAQFHITAGVRRQKGAGAAIVGQTVTNYGSVWTCILTASGNTVRLTVGDGTGAVVDWNGEIKLKPKTARQAVT